MNASAYRTREVAAALGLTPRQVRSFVYSGLLRPARGQNREYRYSFQDLVLLRLGRRLTSADVPVSQASRALQALRSALPTGEPLASVDVDALGEVVIARDRQGVWDPESGQRYFDFTLPSPSDSEDAGNPGPEDATVVDLASWRSSEDRPVDSHGAPLQVVPRGDQEGVAPGTEASETEASEREASRWYDLACDLEGVDRERAKAAYRRAILLSRKGVDAHANLGRLLYEEGDLQQAANHFGLAFELDSRNAIAAYNLGVVLDDLQQPDAALQAYRRAVEADPCLGVAHFNLSRLYEARGDTAAALRHLAEYRRLEGSSASD